MAEQEVLATPPEPKIYAYTTAEYQNRGWESGDGEGLLKVGFTTKRNAEDRIREQFPTLMPEQPWILQHVAPAIGEHGPFSDHEIHQILKKNGIRRVNGEWFECTVDDVKSAITEAMTGVMRAPDRQFDFKPRPEQQAAVTKTSEYYRAHPKSREGRPPRFLWNAKMRFGKTFAAYQLALEMDWTKILVLTFKPAVEDAWREDLESHVDFDGWQFLGKGDTFDDVDETKPLVWFASFQDVLGRTRDGQIKERLEALHLLDWDCLVLDEYHFGAWNESSRAFYENEPDEAPDQEGFSEETFPLGVDHFLYLSGTPFRSLASGDFLEDEIFSWTYNNEQKAKHQWEGDDNPYRALPMMGLMTYVLPDEIRRIAENTDQNEFDLNEFFSASEETGEPVFKHEKDVQKWIDLIRGQHLPYDPDLAGDDKVAPPIPFEDIRLLSTLKHTFWFLPDVASCKAMGRLLQQEQNSFFHDYEIVVAAGPQAGTGLEALPPVREAIGPSPLKSRSITLSCGKLTTGVTIPEWSGIFMLKNLSSPETYFQAAFRVQSPWTYRHIDPEKGEIEDILKPTCYVFDFSPNRALRLIVQYATELSSDNRKSPEEQIKEFLNYLPVLCYDGYGMYELDAARVLDFAATGTASSALALRWQSARLVDVGNETLGRLLDHPDLVDRLEQFEAFRNLARDITSHISREKEINKLKTEKDKLDRNEKKAVSEGEKEIRSFRKRLQENLLRFTARVPVFMYLTDRREETLIDVIEAVEPDLFRKVTNLDVSDFVLLKDIGILNPLTMNSAVFAFRRFEDSSLHYADVDYDPLEDIGEAIGGYDSYATKEDVVTGQVG